MSITLTRFERVRILGQRATQLSMGSKSTIDVSKLNSKDPISIAKEELKQGKLPMIIKREYPNGHIERITISN